MSKNKTIPEYFQHDCNAPVNPKIKLLYKKFGYEGLGLFWELAEKLNSLLIKGIELNEIFYESHSDHFTTPAKVKEIIDYCIKFKLFHSIDNFLYSKRAIENKILRFTGNSVKSKASFIMHYGKQTDKVNPIYQETINELNEILMQIYNFDASAKENNANAKENNANAKEKDSSL